MAGVPADIAPIRPLIEGILRRWSPHQIWLFGSRVRGDPAEDSDWDLLVVVDDATPEQDLDVRVGWALRREARVRADVIPCRLGEFLEDQGTPNTLAYEAVHEGGLLYER
jgi:predicted nucleotidyltransferase